MHLIATLPGGWMPGAEGVAHVAQAPGDLLFLSAGDTELATFQRAWESLHRDHAGLPSARLANLLHFRQEATVDTYVDEVVLHARLVVLRLLGGSEYYRYLVEAFRAACAGRGLPLMLLPGCDRPDLELMHGGTAGLELAGRVWRHLAEGGVDNMRAAQEALLNAFFGTSLPAPPPVPVPGLFLHHPDRGILEPASAAALEPHLPRALLLAYRTHYLADNLEPFRDLHDRLAEAGFLPLTLFAASLRDREMEDRLLELMGRPAVVVATTGFTLPGALLDRVGVPAVQAILSSSPRAAWAEGLFGLSPTDVAMSVALPEMDGRIIGRAVSFKEAAGRDPLTDCDLARYSSHASGVAFTTELARRLHRLQVLPEGEKRLALILPNYPSRDARMANGVGLDTPESAVEVLRALREAGWDLGERPLPRDGTELMERIAARVTYDPQAMGSRPSEAVLGREEFAAGWAALAPGLRERVGGSPEGPFALPGLRFGKVWVTVQPPRASGPDPRAAYHSPDVAPPVEYVAFYLYLGRVFRPDAVIHLGKHGNLEWLPGKSLAPDPESCFPAALLGPIPHFYPFIVNDPGEGTQAKRRTHAVIVDHLIPPMTRADSHGATMRLEHLIDEYYEAAQLDPRRAERLRARIRELVEEARLHVDLGLPLDDVDALLVELDGYLCELKEAQIRDGLHVLGRPPEGAALADLLLALHRVGSGERRGWARALAADLGLEFDPLVAGHGEPLGREVLGVACRTVGQGISRMEEWMRDVVREARVPPGFPRLQDELRVMRERTLPDVLACRREVSGLLDGLRGRHVPPGSSGAPTRGRLDVLPTGRNFYSVDVRTVPTPSAWEQGRRSADRLIELYLQEHGEYPDSVGLSVWGTSTMRTGGEDLAQALALLGVRPVWQETGRRVADFEVLSLLELGRPRVDVTLRVSGFFRDAFPDLISLFHAAVERVVAEPEPASENPLRRRYLEERLEWSERGLGPEEADERALHRVFGSRPGAYGAGLQSLIDGRLWDGPGDLARAYVEWSGYAYGRHGRGRSAPEAWRRRLGNLDVVLQNRDNREHDLLDSAEYYEYHGGMAAAARAEGADPDLLFGDLSIPEAPRVGTLRRELLRVYRSRAVNPRWVEGMRRHGYKGAFEMAATLDYLFSWDASTGLVEDFMYDGLARAYLLDPPNREFLARSNPWAMRDMAERLLEAAQRGLWGSPEPEVLEGVQGVLLEGEGWVEDRA